MVSNYVNISQPLRGSRALTTKIQLNLLNFVAKSKFEFKGIDKLDIFEGFFSLIVYYVLLSSHVISPRTLDQWYSSALFCSCSHTLLTCIFTTNQLVNFTLFIGSVAKWHTPWVSITITSKKGKYTLMPSLDGNISFQIGVPDVIQQIREDRLRHARGPVQTSSQLH